ncbi:MAG: CidA/LrgA family protein [Cellulosilyticaceae bacterium]
MHILRQIAVLFALCLLGEVIGTLIPVPIPASVISMMLLLALLLKGILKLEHIEDIGKFLLGNMAFFFVPIGVSIMEHSDLLKATLGPILVICIVTTVLTFAATGFTVQIVMKWQQKKKENTYGKYS